MKSRPSFQFYPGDWLRDPGLRSCSLAARGLWIDMLCFMHESEPYGHLRLNGRDIEPEALARMVGTSVDDLDRLLKELEATGVFSRTETGTIFSRRMVRDEHLRIIRGEGGHLSAQNPAVPRKKDEGKDTAKDTFQPSIPPSIQGSPSSSSSSSLSSSVSNQKEKDMPPAVDPCFEELWNTYPAKNGKKIRKQETLMRFMRLKPADRQLAVRAAGNYAKSARVLAGYIMDPHGWLKKGKAEPWRDWIEPEQQTNPGESTNGHELPRTGFAKQEWESGVL